MSANGPGLAAQPSSIALIGTLAGIAVMSGLLVAITYQVTLEPIKKNRREALERAVFTVLPDATSRRNFVLDESALQALPDDAIAEANVYAGYNDAGEFVGVAMEGSARGYQDVVKVLYGYSPKTQTITGVTVLQSSETPGLGDRVETDPDFLANFDALDARLNPSGDALANAIVTVKHGKKTNGWQIDAISGATITSNAIGKALDQSASHMLPLLQRHKDALQTSKSDQPTDGTTTP